MSGLVPGLQNQLERFDSASDLQQRQLIFPKNQLFFLFLPHPENKNKLPKTKVSS